MSIFRRHKARLSYYPLDVEKLRGGPRNDARSYGVLILPAQVRPGQAYWRVLRVHHLTPEENRGDRALFLDVVDEEGRRVPGARVRVIGPQGAREYTLQPDEKAPGVRVEMERWVFYEAEVADGPSERVAALSAAHPAEGKGNPEGRHSFLVVWERVLVPVAEEPPREEAPARGQTEEVPETPAVPVAQAEPEVAAEPEPASVPEPEVAVEPEPEPVPAPAAEAPEELELVEGVPEAEAVIPAHRPSEEEPEEPAVVPAAPSPPPAAERVDAPAVVPAEEGAEEPTPVVQVPTPPLDVEVGADMDVAYPPSDEETRPFHQFLLFVDGRSPHTWSAFVQVEEQVRAAEIPFAFDAWDAAQQAQRVIIVGHPPEDRVRALEEAGIEVIVLDARDTSLVEQLEHALGVG
ncbi:MAG: hypothetical protein GXO55_08605 [Chloroflexi bacterium]|nr:hypothetical protein [Chloroflexota bacterium]